MIDEVRPYRPLSGAIPERQAFLPRIRDLVVTGGNKIMKAVSFSPPLPTSSA